MNAPPSAASVARARPAPDADLVRIAALPAADVYAALETDARGLEIAEAARRLVASGPNEIARQQRVGWAAELWAKTANPLNALLLVLALASLALGDVRAAAVIAVMVVLAVTTAFVQEHRSTEAAARLRAMVHTTASVCRRHRTGESGFHEVPLRHLVPGDIVRLSAGDMIPADLRLVSAKDLFVNQSALTGEAMPVEKSEAAVAPVPDDPFDIPNLAFMGANVVSGYATAVVLRTGAHSFFGALAHDLGTKHVDTAFDQGLRRFTLMMIGLIGVMVPLVFVINGVTKGDWIQALFFAMAVGVGLTPEMLPMIVTVNLAKGAISMAREKVIVKRLEAIQNFGAMDVLCTDKTGTLTQDRIILKQHLDMRGEDSALVLDCAYLNSYFQSGLRNLLDEAVLAHEDLHTRLGIGSAVTKADEIPFDFTRRRLSIVVARADGTQELVCKGAVEEIFQVCTHYVCGDESGTLDASHFATAQAETRALNAEGFRVIAVARKVFPTPKAAYTVADECDLELVGYIAFLDPPKDSARAALEALAASGVQVKVLTGDNDVVTRKVCRDVGLDPGDILVGADLAALDDDALAAVAGRTRVFAKLTPAQKERVVRALHAQGHVVGFMGDGINDSPALKAADVGISVDTAVDVAKESAEIILLEKDLRVLQKGVIEGRRVFANVTKYIRMGASSNFGNMFSVLGASLFLPFLPMAPIQVLTNNLLYDFSQSTIPTDNVDAEYLAAPRRWDIGDIFRFMLFIGPISSIFDYATFGMMLYVFGAWTNASLFQTGWFVESLLTQTLIIHVIRTAKVPFLESRASGPMIATTLAICAFGVMLPTSWLGGVLGFSPLPAAYWPLLVALLVAYALLTHVAKRWFVRRYGM